MSMGSEFKTFLNQGNVLGLAVGVIIGGGFGKIVSSLTDDIIMPIVGAVTGGIDFSNKFIVLGDAAGKDVSTLAKVKEAGVAFLGWGKPSHRHHQFYHHGVYCVPDCKTGKQSDATSSGTSRADRGRSAD